MKDLWKARARSPSTLSIYRKTPSYTDSIEANIDVGVGFVAPNRGDQAAAARDRKKRRAVMQ